ncbi:MAG: hypothetical protein MZV64_00225 [Ignavibacteriales bacterium]|nr:hypothetical protein [Ignavibacteriales bacterium]
MPPSKGHGLSPPHGVHAPRRADHHPAGGGIDHIHHPSERRAVGKQQLPQWLGELFMI